MSWRNGDCGKRRIRPGIVLHRPASDAGSVSTQGRLDTQMLRQKWGSVVCPSCGNLVGVNDERCFTCGRWNPGLWGFAPVLNRLGRDLGFTQFVMGACIILYFLSLVADAQGISMGGFNFLAPSVQSLFLFGA